MGLAVLQDVRIMIDLTHPEIGIAARIVHQASLLSKRIQNEMVVTTLTKEDHSPVTVADFAVQAFLGYSLSKAFPEDPMVAEENSNFLSDKEGKSILKLVTQSLGPIVPGVTGDDVCNWIDHGGQSPSERFWTLDPIDGTKGFLRGGQYAVALALLVNGKVQIGILGCPNLDGGILVVAARKQGCWKATLSDPQTFHQLQVSECSDPHQAQIACSFESSHTNVTQLDGLTATLGVKTEPVKMDSQAKYVLLAEGNGDLLFRLVSPQTPEYTENIWDHAAGSLVLEEAGGQITDLTGKTLDFSAGKRLVHNHGVLASNGHLHTIALAALTRNSTPI